MSTPKPKKEAAAKEAATPQKKTPAKPKAKKAAKTKDRIVSSTRKGGVIMEPTKEASNG